jgi:hypothetical protein
VARSLHVLARGVQIDDHSGVISDEARILFGERQLLKNQAVASRWAFPSRVLANLTIQTPKCRMIEIVSYRPDRPAEYQRLTDVIRAIA